MSSSGTSADVFEMPATQLIEPTVRLRSGDVASGQPVADPPRLIEPMVEPVTGRRPPRRRFLAFGPKASQTAPKAPQIATAQQLDVPDIPQFVEPVAEPPMAAPEISPSAATLPGQRAWRAWFAQRLAAAHALLPSGPRTRLAAAATCIAALGLIVWLVRIPDAGLFYPARQ
jgi:hypothetical protein